MIAFNYAVGLNADAWAYQIGLYDLVTGLWRTIPTPSREHCSAGKVRWLNKLPDNGLGFLVDCNLTTVEGVYQGTKDTLYEWDANADNILWLRDYAELDFRAADYTFSPDMGRLIQSRIDGKAFEADSYGNLREILTKYTRIMSPRFSPDGQRLAFAGNDEVPDNSPETFPWDLYIAGADGSNPTVVASGIRFASFVKWSPRGPWLSFRGNVNGKDGIWILDTGTSKITQVWADQTYYDWSPDATRMVVIERLKRLEVDGEEITRPIIVDLELEPVNSNSEIIPTAAP